VGPLARDRLHSFLPKLGVPVGPLARDRRQVPRSTSSPTPTRPKVGQRGSLTGPPVGTLARTARPTAGGLATPRERGWLACGRVPPFSPGPGSLAGPRAGGEGGSLGCSKTLGARGRSKPRAAAGGCRGQENRGGIPPRFSVGGPFVATLGFDLEGLLVRVTNGYLFSTLPMVRA